MNLIDHVDLESTAGRRVDRALEKLGHFIDAAVRRCVHLDVVDESAAVDLRARGAAPARCIGDPGLAVEALGKDARERRLADAASPGQKIRVVQALLRERIAQRAYHVFLPYQARE